MRCRPPIVLALGLAIASFALGEDLSLADIRRCIDDQLAALGGIAMRVDVSRYVSSGGKTRSLDDFETSVELAGEDDQFGILRRNGRPLRQGANVAGAWSFGEFSTLLRISREALEDSSVPMVSGPEARTLTAHFHDPPQSRKWFVTVNSRIYWLGFDGEVVISRDTGEVLTLSWISDPPGDGSDIVQIRRAVRFEAGMAGGKTVMAPRYAEYQVVHAGDRVEWNTLRFSGARRFGAMVSVRFDDDED